MKKASFFLLCSAMMLTACADDQEPTETEQVDEGSNEQVENDQLQGDQDETEVEEETETDHEFDDSSEEEEEKDEKEVEDQSSEKDEADEVIAEEDGLNPEGIIHRAIEAEAQFSSYSLEWQHHDVADDGSVMEAKGFTLIKYMENENGPDYFYREDSGVELEENEASTIYEAQTPEARTLYIEGEDQVTLQTAADEFVPTISIRDLHEFINQSADYQLNYRGIFETEGYEAYHIFAVTENEDTEINLWFDTETGIQVRQNEFFAGYNGTVSRLTMFDSDVELTEADFQISNISQYPVVDER
ncbi:hypothetical protein [Shouchella miscanthi]|uniref:Outer membrane lipoprotein carrier protein LolA n=1 Tax=Shouchella miscanthi TaxID=2598861 RepID=A0ABU6NPW4_9BACI|nr:hypothetical protein [Shouchella miscanthi]